MGKLQFSGVAISGSLSVFWFVCGGMSDTIFLTFVSVRGICVRICLGNIYLVDFFYEKWIWHIIDSLLFSLVFYHENLFYVAIVCLMTWLDDNFLRRDKYSSTTFLASWWKNWEIFSFSFSNVSRMVPIAYKTHTFSIVIKTKNKMRPQEINDFLFHICKEVGRYLVVLMIFEFDDLL